MLWFSCSTSTVPMLGSTVLKLLVWYCPDKFRARADTETSHYPDKMMNCTGNHTAIIGLGCVVNM